MVRKPNTYTLARNIVGKPYGICLECRRKRHNENPRKFLQDLLTTARGRSRGTKTGDATITLDHLSHLLTAQHGLCPLTGLRLTFLRSHGRVFTNASLDRIDQSKGYIPGNVRLVTMWANLARNNLNDKDFIFFCDLVAHRSRKTDDPQRPNPHNHGL